MARAIGQLGSGLTVGRAGLGFYGDEPGSVRQQVTDGDTVNVRALEDFGLRLLGVDAPEIGYSLPGGSGGGGPYTKLSDARWEGFFSDPFAENLAPFEPALDAGLVEYLRGRAGSGAAGNHYGHASAAEDALEGLVLEDLEALGQDEEEFRFFMAFAYEVMDRYGRFLCFVNREQPDAEEPAPRPPSYNERLLTAGTASPYFIWPNVNPFRRAGSVAEAVVRPGEAARTAEEDGSLRSAREAVKDARRRGIGIFGTGAPLRLEAFEVRFLAERRPPSRWVIDLGAEDDALISPQRYFTVPNAEDRLFVPEEYVPLFVEAGWRRG